MSIRVHVCVKDGIVCAYGCEIVCVCVHDFPCAHSHLTKIASTSSTPFFRFRTLGVQILESQNTDSELAKVCFDESSTGWRRPTACHIFWGHFLQKNPMIIGSFAERNPHLKALYVSLASYCMDSRFCVTHHANMRDREKETVFVAYSC